MLNVKMSREELDGGWTVIGRQRLETSYTTRIFHTDFGELRLLFFFNQTARVGDCWNCGKMSQDIFCGFYFVSVEFE